jgi:hypothetical protein
MKNPSAVPLGVGKGCQRLHAAGFHPAFRSQSAAVKPEDPCVIPYSTGSYKAASFLAVRQKLS